MVKGRIVVMIHAINSELNTAPPKTLPVFSNNQAEKKEGIMNKAATRKMKAPKRLARKAIANNFINREMNTTIPILK